jgi:CO dehydrogenase nickel-insertion accessory protein CooC1
MNLKTPITTFCEKYLRHYTINSDGTVDVDGDVNLHNKLGDMEKLPVKFGKVSGHFDCRYNKLTTLEGCPNYVGGYFICDDNNLSTMEGCPNYVGSGFYCDDNKLYYKIQRDIYDEYKQRIVI